MDHRELKQYHVIGLSTKKMLSIQLHRAAAHIAELYVSHRQGGITRQQAGAHGVWTSDSHPLSIHTDQVRQPVT